MAGTGLLALMLGMASPAEAEVKFKVQVNPVADLVYQLDCVSGFEPRCSVKNYTELWGRYFLKSEAQRATLKSWKSLRQKINETVRHSAGSEFDLNSKVQIASAQATGFDDFLTRLDLLVSPKKRNEIYAILTLYWPSFERWWKKEAQRVGTPVVAETRRLLMSASVQKRLGQFQRFYQAKLPPDLVMSVTLHYRPIFFEEAGSGTEIDNYARMEFGSGEKSVRLLDVMIHEFCHFLYRASDGDQRENLKGVFLAQNTVESVAAFALLDEVLATALGNGIYNRETMKDGEWKKYLSRDNSFYNDPAIDKGSKGLLPSLDKYLGGEGTLYDGDFAGFYVSVLKGVLGKSLTSPKNVLREIAMVTDFEDARGITNEVIDVLRPTGVHGSGPNLDNRENFEFYENNPAVSGLFIVHPDGLRKLHKGGYLTEEQFRVAGSKVVPFAVSFRRSPAAFLFLIVAKEKSQVLKELKALSERTETIDDSVPLSL